MAEYDLIYSTQTTDFESGKRYENPTYFNGRVTPSKGIKIIGDWPLVKQAYEAAKIPVIEEGNVPKKQTKPKGKAKAEQDSETTDDLGDGNEQDAGE